MFARYLFLGLVVMSSSCAFCDTWKNVGPRLFVSDSHEFAVQVTPDRDPLARADAKLFGFTPMGDERVIWRGKLVNHPHEVYVAEPYPGSAPTFASVDTYGLAGGEHSLVIYRADGTVVKDYKLEDLLTPNELRLKVARTVSSRRWARSGHFALAYRDVLVIPLLWGGAIEANLDSGKVLRRKGG